MTRTRRRLLVTLALALAFGFIVGTLPGGQRQLSIDLWLAVTVIWIGLESLGHTLAATPIRPSPLRLLWWPQRFVESEPEVPPELRSLEGALAAAGGSERAFQVRVRPQLIELVEHRLQINHGVELDHSGPASLAALGDSDWLVDSAERDRAPTPDDLHRLLDRLDDPDQAR